MQVRIKQMITLSIVLFLIMAGFQFVSIPAAYADTATIDSVRAAIQALSADPSSYKESDRKSVEAINADFKSLSAEDQNTLDHEESHPSAGQPLGRVLEAALWAVWSYNEVDDSTTLPDGTYDATTTPALSSVYSKGKSTSSRQRPWSVKSVTVSSGKATATITVESDSYSHIWTGGSTLAKTNTSGNSEFAGIPIDLNSTFYFAGVSTSMPVPIAFSLTTTIEEPKQDDPPKPADYTAVDTAIASVPTDLSIYTEESAAAVAAAVNSVVRDKTEAEQDTVDAMAKAISDAVAALVLKPADYTDVDTAVASVPADLSIYTDETAAAVTAAVNAVIRNKPITEQTAVDAMAKAIDDAVAALILKPADYTAVDAAIASVPVDLSIYTDETAAAVTAAVNAVVRNKPVTEQAEVDAMATAISDAVKLLVIKEETDPSIEKADYSKVDAAIASIPVDLSIYTDETVAAVNTAKNAVVRGKLITEQSEVDTMAKAIDDAVKALVERPADYSAVDVAIASIPADLSVYTDETAAAVNAAKDAVVRDKTITAQAEVDAMAKAITDAVNALVEKKDPEIIKKKTTISIVKRSNIKTIKAGGKKLKKTKTFTVKTKASSKAKTTYKKTVKGRISVSKGGKVTLKKGLKKGRYKIKVTVSAAETSSYKAAVKTITIKITVR